MKKKYLFIGICLFATAIIPAGFKGYGYYLEKEGKLSASEMKKLYISNEEVTIPGLQKEYNLFFIANSHISLCVQERLWRSCRGVVECEAFFH